VKNLKHLEWLSFSMSIGGEFAALVESLRTSALAPAAQAFTSNISRALLLASLPTHLVLAGKKLHLAEIGASQLLYGRPYREINDDDWGIFDIFDKVRNAIFFGTITNPIPARVSISVSDRDVHRVTDNLLHPLFESLMSTQIVMTWTAFETLAGDLWVASVNAQPEHLASLTGTESRIRKLLQERSSPAHGGEPGEDKPQEAAGEQGTHGDLDDDAGEPRGKTSVTLGDMFKVTKGKYDLGGRMGTLLVQAKRVQFTSLEGIRGAYSLAFSEKVKRARAQRIDAALANKGLDALSAVRNLIIHKAAIADAVYLDDCKTAPTAPLLKEGESLQLDGEMCQTMIVPVIKASVELVKAVDSWLALTRR
jgi:hypothetical protein